MLLATPVYADADTVASVSSGGGLAGATGAVTFDGVPSYMEYYEQYKDSAKPAGEGITIDGINDLDPTDPYENADVAETTQDGKTGAVLNAENKYLQWTFTVPQAGIYNITPTYYPLADGDGDTIGRAITLDMTIDGASPYTEAKAFSLSRMWKDAGDPKTDELGNHVRPQQVEVQRWIEASFVNELGMYSDPYYVYLEAGEHTLQIIQSGRRDKFLFHTQKGSRNYWIQIQVRGEEVLLPHACRLRNKTAESALFTAAEDRQQVHGRIQFRSFVDAPVHVDGHAGNHQQIAVHIHQFCAEQLTLPHDYPSGNRQGPVQPRAVNHPAVGLHAQPHTAAGRGHLRLLPYLERGRIAVGGGNHEAADLP